MSHPYVTTISSPASPVIDLIVKGNALTKARRKRTSPTNAPSAKNGSLLVRPTVTPKISQLRHLTITAVMFITDDETFGSDEHGSATQTVSTFLSGQFPQNLLHLEKGVGDEVRVELDLTGQALTNGDVLIIGLAQLFEGTSENTTDLDGVRNFNVLVPKNHFSSFQINIRNDDEGGDHAEIFLNCSNLAG